MNNWYGRSPIILDGVIYFISGNDIFKIQNDEPVLCFQGTGKLTQLLGYKNSIACVSEEAGAPDIYLYDTMLKTFTRLTFLEKDVKLMAFTNEYIEFLSAQNAFNKMYVFRYNFSTAQIVSMNIGPVNHITRHANDIFIQKYGYGYINWRNYKGGTAGQIWKNDKKLIDLKHNCLTPVCHENSLFFLSDNGVCGNIFSCDFSGENVQQVTHFKDFAVQDLYYNSGKLIYSKCGEIWIYDIANKTNTQVIVPGYLATPATRNYLTNAMQYLTSFSTNGKIINCSLKGHVFQGQIWSGGMEKLSNTLRFIHSGFLNDTQTFAFKEPPSSALYIYENQKEIKKFEVDFGKIIDCKAANKKSFIAYANHRHELHIFDYTTGEDTLVIKGSDLIDSFDISPDGNWIAYSMHHNFYQCNIRIYNISTKEHHDVTPVKNMDHSPSFDPSGEFLCFLSNVANECTHDAFRFNLYFQNIFSPYIVSLKKESNLLAPWKNQELKIVKKEDESEDAEEEKRIDIDKIELEMKIDLDNITSRIRPIPVKNKAYIDIFAIKNSKIMLMSSENIEDDEDDEDDAKSIAHGGYTIETFCLNDLSCEKTYANVAFVNLSHDKEHCVIMQNNRIKILKTGEKCEGNAGYKKTAFDISKIKCVISPKDEWQQMLHEIWWLIKEFFWSPKMAGLDWDAVWGKYDNISQKIRSKHELSNIIETMLGEVGTSHAFFMSNDKNTQQKRGYLGAEYEIENETQLTKISKIFESSIEDSAISPLQMNESLAHVGEYIFSINGVAVSAQDNVDKLLAHTANTSITLEVGLTHETKRCITITALESEELLQYRNWISENVNLVKMQSEDIGYIHAKDMGSAGFKEFTQKYMQTYRKKWIILDMRYNRGGNISALLLDQIQRKKTGVDMSRWHGIPEIPHQASHGNFVLLINAHTSSDAEIFAHQFKMLNLGHIIGERTWGGVVGIMPRYKLIDNSKISVPEFCTWFSDVGHDLENTGVAPHEEVINAYDNDKDSQLERAINFIQEQMKNSAGELSLEEIAIKQPEPRIC